MLESIISTYGFDIISTIILIIVSVLAYQIKKIYNQYATTDEKERIVAGIVRYVQQVYDALDGDEKKNIAIIKVKDILEKYNITVSEEELDILIEKSVYEMKNAVNALDGDVNAN